LFKAIAFEGFLCPLKQSLKIKLRLCLCKAFPPLTAVTDLKSTIATVTDYLFHLRKKYNARNTRHLIYILYERNSKIHPPLKASKRGIEILAYFSKGETYKEIAQRFNISDRCVEKHLDRMRNNNRLQIIDELVVLYADWEYEQMLQGNN